MSNQREGGNVGGRKWRQHKHRERDTCKSGKGRKELWECKRRKKVKIERENKKKNTARKGTRGPRTGECCWRLRAPRRVFPP